MIEFANGENLKIANTFYNKKSKRKWSWISPDQKTINESAHILTNNLRIIRDVSILSNFRIFSDQRAGRCRIEIPRRVRIQNYRKTEILGKRIIPVKRWGKVREVLKDKRGEKSGEEKYRQIKESIVEVTKKYGVKRKEVRTGYKLTNETLELIDKKNTLWKNRKGKKRNKVEDIELGKLIKER